MTGIGLDTEVNAIVGGEHGVDRQKSREERKDRDDCNSSNVLHVSLVSAANSLLGKNHELLQRTSFIPKCDRPMQKPATGFPARAANFDDEYMRVICPTCQILRRGVDAPLASPGFADIVQRHRRRRKGSPKVRLIVIAALDDIELLRLVLTRNTIDQSVLA